MALPIIRKFLGVLSVAMLMSGCAGSPIPQAAPPASSLPVEADAATPTDAAPTTTETASEAPQLRIVSIGDSIAAAELCGCARFPDLLGELAGDAFGRKPWIQNLAVNGATSGALLDSLASPVQQSAIRGADIITVTIGINDINQCGAEDDRACYERGIAEVASNLLAILDRIEALQGDHPHALRQTAYYNFNIGDPGVAQFGPSFQAFYAEQLAALNAEICGAVTDHGGLCVELLMAFNGPAGDADAGPLLVSDHAHPSREGHRAIADAIAASGFAPLD